MKEIQDLIGEEAKAFLRSANKSMQSLDIDKLDKDDAITALLMLLETASYIIGIQEKIIHCLDEMVDNSDREIESQWEKIMTLENEIRSLTGQEKSGRTISRSDLDEARQRYHKLITLLSARLINRIIDKRADHGEEDSI